MATSIFTDFSPNTLMNALKESKAKGVRLTSLLCDEKIIFFDLVLNNLDVKKERRRNLIPAKIGFYSIMIFVFFGFLNGLAHSVPFLDNGTRALYSAIFNDAYYCVLAPALILYGVPSLRRNLSNYIPF